MVYSSPLDYQFSMPIIEKLPEGLSKAATLVQKKIVESVPASPLTFSYLYPAVGLIVCLVLGLAYWYREYTEESFQYIEHKINLFFDSWEFSRFWDSQTNTFRTRVVDPSDLLPF